MFDTVFADEEFAHGSGDEDENLDESGCHEVSGWLMMGPLGNDRGDEAQASMV